MLQACVCYLKSMSELSSSSKIAVDMSPMGLLGLSLLSLPRSMFWTIRVCSWLDAFTLRFGSGVLSMAFLWARLARYIAIDFSVLSGKLFSPSNRDVRWRSRCRMMPTTAPTSIAVPK